MRTRQGPAGAPHAGHGGGPSAHAPGAPPEAVPGRDEQIAQIFTNMRLAMRVSRETVARRLATTTFIIDSFEAGSIGSLPHWKETTRIVRGYCEVLRLDPEPILWRLRSRLQAAAASPPTPGAALATPPEPASAASPASLPPPRTPSSEAVRSPAPPARRRGQQVLVGLAVPVLLLAVAAGLVHLAPRAVYRAAILLPDPIEGPLRSGIDYLTLLTAPHRDGLRWVDVGDPRLRKADKLPTSTLPTGVR
jgi:hypothetical protein